MPFFIACLIAYMVNPIYRFLNYRVFGKMKTKRSERVKNMLSLILAYIIFLGIITIILLYIIPEFFTSISDLTANIPMNELIHKLENFLTDIEEYFPMLDFNIVEEKINELTPQLLSFSTDFVKNLLPKLLNVSYLISMSIVRVIINMLLSLVISAYLLASKDFLSRGIMRLLYAFTSKKRADSIAKVAVECNNIFSKFIIGKAIDSLIIGILCFFLMLILRLPYAILLSVIVGVTNMIPYFGPFIGAIPGIVVFLFVNPVQAIIFGVMVLALQQFDGLILGPKILGDSTGLKPLWVILAITVGGAYYGVLGMFLGVPVVAVISYLLNLLINYRLKQKHMLEN